jgi:two-component system NtrC family sensor kinase
MWYNERRQGIITIRRDITERKRSEEELERIYQRLSDIIDFLPDATFVIDRDKKVIAWNKAVEEMTGVKKEDMLGKGDYAYAVPFYGKPRPIIIDLVLERDKKFENRYGNVHVEGSKLLAEVFVPKIYGGKGAYISCTASPLFDHSGNIVGAIESVRDVTEHKRIEKALQESEERYRTAIESSNDGIVLVRGDSHIYANRKFLDIFGYDSPQEVVGKTHHLTVHPDDQEKVAGYNRRRQRGEAAPVRYEFKGMRKNGDVIYIEVSAAATTYQGKSVSIAFMRDVTERRKAQESLQESEKTLRSLFDAVHETMLLIDREGTVLMSNIVAAERLGKSVQELVGINLYDHFAPNVAEYRKAQYAKVIALGEPVYFEDARAGRYYENYCYPVFDEEENVRAVTIFAHDITERKKAEEEQAKLWSAVEWAGEGIFMLDIDKRFTYVNAAFCKSYGSTREEIIGETMAITRGDSHPQSFYDAVWSVVEAGNIYSGRQTRRRKDGTPIEVELTMAPVRDASGAIIQYVGVAKDITEQLQMEAQLRQAQKMEAIGTLAGGVAHDFNNILAVIMGLGNLIQMTIGPDDRNRPYVDQIVLSAEKAADLTHSLLAFSRKQRINLEPHNLGNIVQSTAKLLKRLLPEDINLELDLADDCIALLDVSQIDQVLMNLATNARDAMPGGGSITIRTKVVTLDASFNKTHGFGKTGEYIRLSVSDAGMGMDEQTMARIFDPFFTTKEVGKGTGLGLASVYGIVKQHNGYVTVTSSPLKGTTFDIYIPLVEATVVTGPATGPRVPGGSETILVIEDDVDVRNMVRDILSAQGYNALAATDGEDGIRVFNEHREAISLIILDMVMPGRSGKDVLEEINRIHPEVKAIFVSGYTGDIVIEKGVRGSHVDFLQKPLSMSKLLGKVREVLDR